MSCFGNYQTVWNLFKFRASSIPHPHSLMPTENYKTHLGNQVAIFPVLWLLWCSGQMLRILQHLAMPDYIRSICFSGTSQSIANVSHHATCVSMLLTFSLYVWIIPFPLSCLYIIYHNSFQMCSRNSLLHRWLEGKHQLQHLWLTVSASLCMNNGKCSLMMTL